MTAFPDPDVRLREVIIRARGRTPAGKYTRVVDFPRILKDTDNDFHVFKRLGIEKPENPVGAFIGIECRYHGYYPGLSRDGEVILDPMLAYLVALLKYGYEEMKSSHSMLEGKEWNPPEPVFPDGFETPLPNKLVKDGVSYYDGCMIMPIFSHGPRGYTGAYGEDPDRNNAVLNCFMAAISFGASTLGSCDNGIPDFRPDDTADRLVVIREELFGGTYQDDLKIEIDSGWSGCSGGRCITDYSRVVTFSHELEPDELTLYIEMLSLDKSPGWTGIGCRRLNGDCQYEFTTTMDSSD